MDTQPPRSAVTQAPEMLCVEEFARRMQISRATVFDWMARNVLVQGRHYLRLGRVVRIPWSDELVTKLLEDCLQPLPEERPQQQAEKQVRRTKRPKTIAINWDYE